MSANYIPPVDNTATQHEHTEHLAVRNTLLRRTLTLVALKTTARFFKWNGPCIPISPKVIVKTSKFVHLTESATMEYVAARTSIPIPRVYCSFVHDNQAYIVMERIRGITLAEALKDLSESGRDCVFAQLRRMLQELRAMAPPPTGRVESCVGGSLRDSRIPRSRPRFGPFKTIQDFHVWLRDGLQLQQLQALSRLTEDEKKQLREMVVKHEGSWALPVFTHADLNPFNILVRGEQIVSIIDWELAGWYPHYWEYTSVWYGSLTRLAWQDYITKFLDPCPEELEMEITRQIWWGD